MSISFDMLLSLALTANLIVENVNRIIKVIVKNIFMLLKLPFHYIII
jgi:hypothetical protein